MATKTLSVVIAGDASGAQSAFKKVEGDADGLSGKLSGLGAKISPGMAAAAGAVVAGVGLMLKGAFDAADESAKIGRETERVLKSTGATAWTTADQVSDYAGELSNLTGVDDEVIQSGENLLLTFTNVQNKVGQGNDVFDRASAAALDMATVMGTDMSSAAVMVGKALNDPRDGLTKLTRAGVTFTDQQKEQIRTLTASGDLLGAQKIMLQELEKEFGGAAAAAATPMDHLKVTIGNLQEQMGNALIPVIGAAAGVLENLVTGFAALPEPVRNVTIGVGALGAGAVGTVAVVAKLADVFGSTLGPALGAARGVLDDAALGVANLSTKFGASQDTALKLANGVSGVGAALPVAGAAALVGVGIWSMYESAQKAAEKRAKEFSKTLDEQTGALTANTTEKVRSTLEENHRIDNLNRAGVSVERYTEAIGDNSTAIMDHDQFMSLWIAKQDGMTQAGDQLIANLRAQGGARNELLATLVETGAADSGLISQIYEETGAYDTNKRVLKERAIQQAVATGMTREQAEADIAAKAAANAHATAIRDLIDATKAAVDPYFAALDATQKLNDAQVAAFLTAQQYGDQAPETQAANEAVARSAMGTEGSYLALAAQMKATGTTSEDMKAAFQRWVDQGALTQGQADQMVFKFGLLGAKADEVSQKNVAIPVSAPGADETIGKLTALHQKMVDIFNTTGSAGQRSIGGVSLYADGGSVSDGWFISGENGPELGYKSGSSVEIFSNSQSGRMLSGGGGGGGGATYMTNNIYMPVGSNGEDVVEALKRYERRNGKAWRD